MRQIYLFIGLVCLYFTSVAQVTTEPQFFNADTQVKIIYDATQGTSNLTGVSSVYMHAGVILSGPTGTSWQNVVGNWGQNNGVGQMTAVQGQPNKWEITITPRSYFNVTAGVAIYRIGMVFREAGPCGGAGGVSTPCKEGKSATNQDIFIDVLQTSYGMTLNTPTQRTFLINQGEEIEISATASDVSDWILSVGSVVVDEQDGIENYSYTHTVSESSGTVEVRLHATDGAEEEEKLFTYTIRTATVNQSKPSGIKKGINYHQDDDSKVTLCLLAPGKTSAYVIGDFNNWALNSDYQMKKDGELFWLEIDGLVSGVEYAFQYVVNETIFIADPYCDKILDQNDKFISPASYPNLKPYPDAAQNAVNYYNTVSVLQTGQQPYVWNVTNFQKPNKEKLVFYELLIRDFFGAGQETYKNLTDTLSYIKSLGVNAIKLMPVTEFSGNDSWGYNPTFMFAPDKAYGPKNELKKLIDKAHQMGFAVILDMVLNHQEQPNPYVLLDFNTSTGAVTGNNPYFNVTATHDFSVFYDMNHLSPYTQAYVDTVCSYWIKEYKFDGYRFDLSKGFMQTGSFYNYNQERIDLLIRMANAIWAHTPDAYVILEHLGPNDEETVLANAGMMLWGIMHSQYKQNILGFNSNADFSWVYHGNRGWNNRHLIGYMESHDEERQMYEALANGNNSNSSHNVRNLNTALTRMRAASAMLFLVPGPKMIWQFGELGYNVSINFNGRIGRKPIPWNSSSGSQYNYYGNSERQALRRYMSEIVKLRNSYPVFTEGAVQFSNMGTLTKQITLRSQPYVANPTNANEMNVVIIANFNVGATSMSVTFPHTGTWYRYFEGSSQNISSQITSISIGAGEFVIFTDVQLETPQIVLGAEESKLVRMDFHPNPATTHISINPQTDDQPLYFFIYDMAGKEVKRGKFHNESYQVDIQHLTSGLHVIEIITRQGERAYLKLMKN
jgi:glycosidase